MNLYQIVYDFLKKRCDLTRPILLGLSGGPDSLCLFYLLLAITKEMALNIHIAHVDHSWRPESQQEAQQLGLLAAKYAIPFHLRVLDPSSLKGNLEAACREERIRFFSELSIQNDCQAVMLGHHANDQAETILKRLFEGGSMLGLTALQEEVRIGHLTIWRPLLTIPKRTLEDWLQAQSVTPFDDSTNLDPRFLRARLRTQIIPELSRTFGKNIQDPLCRFGKEAADLQDYFDRLTIPYMNSIVTSKIGRYLDLQTHCPHEFLEMRHLIKRFCSQGDLDLSYDQLQKASEMALSGVSNRHFTKGQHTLYVDRKRLFIPYASALKDLPKDRMPLHIGKITLGSWVIEVEKTDRSKPYANTSWKELWQGGCEAIIPLGDHHWALPSPADSYQGRKKTLGSLWTDHQVPAFLRDHVPVLVSGGGNVQHEFLTGRSSNLLRENEEGLLVRFRCAKVDYLDELDLMDDLDKRQFKCV